MTFTVDSRVESNEVPKKYGNTTESVRMMVWMVIWDGETREVERGSTVLQYALTSMAIVREPVKFLGP